MAEHSAVNRGVAGSSPARGATKPLRAEPHGRGFFDEGHLSLRERPVYEFFRKILLTHGVSFGKMFMPGSIRKGNMAGDPKRTDKEDKQESMRSKLNRFIALLLLSLIHI